MLLEKLQNFFVECQLLGSHDDCEHQDCVAVSLREDVEYLSRAYVEDVLVFGAHSEGGVDEVVGRCEAALFDDVFVLEDDRVLRLVRT